MIDKGEIVERDFGTAQILNTSLSNNVINLKNAEYANCDPISDNIKDILIKDTLKAYFCYRHTLLLTTNLSRLFDPF